MEYRYEEDIQPRPAIKNLRRTRIARELKKGTAYPVSPVASVIAVCVAGEVVHGGRKV